MIAIQGGALWRKPVRPVAAVALVSLILLLPAMVHGAPFLFFDSEEYFQVAKAMFNRLFGGAGETAGVVAAGPIVGPEIAAEPVQDGGILSIAASRPPTYPLFLYLSSVAATIWATALLQAAICAVLIVRFLVWSWGEVRLASLLVLAGVLSLASGLGFHAAFIMPDVFTGCLALVLALYLIARPQGRMENALLLGAAFLFATTHTTNVLLVISALVAMVIVTLAERAPLKPMLPRLGAVAGVAIAALLATSAWTFAIRAVSGEEARSPPYLMARLIADGPGADYLAEACTGGQAPFAACAFAGKRFYSDPFLWDPGAGGYAAATPDMRAALQDEEKRFVAAVIAAKPVEQATASLVNFGWQLTATGIREVDGGLAAFAATPAYRGAAVLGVTPGAKACLADAACHEPGWLKAWNAVVRGFNFLLLPLLAGLTAWLLTGGRRVLGAAGERSADLLRCGAFLGLLTLANSAACAVLSGPFDRYETRMIWALALSLGALAPGLARAWLSRRGATPAGRTAV